MNFIEWLQGKKTYIITIAGGILNILVALNVVQIDAQWLQVVDAIFVMLFGVALRAGVSKSGPVA